MSWSWSNWIDLGEGPGTCSISSMSLSRREPACGVLEPEFNTGTDTGRILVTVLGMVAEMELRFIRERQRAGIDNAKRNGVYKGRKPSVPVALVRNLKAKGRGATEIAKELGISRVSVYRALKHQN